MSKKSVRYEFDWNINDENGDCTARVTRSVLYNLQPNQAEESKFQIHITKNIFRITPWPGQDVFKQIPPNEYEKFVAIAKSFYAGVNSSKDFYYWELWESQNENPLWAIDHKSVKKAKNKGSKGI